MKQVVVLLMCGALAASSLALSRHDPAERFRSDPEVLSDLVLHLEVDLPDLTTELALESESGQPLVQLSMYDAAGAQLFDLNPAVFSGNGVSEFSVEADGIPLAQALEAYPEGRYLVRARTLSGDLVQAAVLLSHRFPGPFQVLPIEQSGTEGVTISWTPSTGAKRYLLEVESDRLGESFELALNAPRTSVTLPADLFLQGEPYEVSLVAEGDNDNEVEVETGFTAL